MSVLKDESAFAGSGAPDDGFPLSSAQERLWFLHRLDPGDPAYHMCGAVRIRGRLDLERLGRAFAALCERHEALRTVFRADGEHAVQTVLPQAPDTFAVRALDGGDLDAAIAAEARRPFDLGTAAVRAACLRLGAGDHALVVTVHHLVCDGASVEIMVRDLGALYDGGAPLPELTIQWADFARSERSQVDDGSFDGDLDWWRTTLADLPAPLGLHAGDGRGTLELAVPDAVADAVRRLAAAERTTPFAAALAGVALALASQAGRLDLAVATPVACRPSAGTEQLVGLFVNTVPLRVRLAARGSLRETARALHGVVAGALARAQVPFDRIAQEAGPGRAATLAETLFTWQTGRGMGGLDLAGTVVTELPVAPTPGKAPLLVELHETPVEWRLRVEHAGVSAAVAEGVGRRTLELLGGDPDRIIAIEARAGETAQPAAVTVRATPPPEGDLEATVARAWREVLGVERVGRDDDFFALGGHSLLAARLLFRIRALTGADLPLRALFDAPTVAALADRVRAARPARPDPIAPAPPGPAVLSSQQRAHWLAHRLDPQGVAYNITGAVRFDASVHADALVDALRTVVARQSALRTTYRIVDGQPQQVVDDAVSVELERRTLDATSSGALDTEVAAAAERLARRPFDLTRDPPLRAVVIESGDGVALALGTTHAAFDGSYDVLRRQLEQAYAAHVGAGEHPDAPAVAYAGYAAWQRRRLPEAIRAHLPYWRERLDGIEPLELPADLPRPKVRSGRGGTQRFTLSARLAQGVRRLAAAEGATVNMVLLTAWLVLLRRLSGQERFAVGCPVDVRPEGAEQLIGCFVDAVPIRADLPDGCAFRAAVARTRAAVLEAHEHSELPFDALVDALGGPRDRSRTPLFQSMFVHAPRPAAPRLGAAAAGWIEWEPRSARFDTLCAMHDLPDGGLGGAVEYATDLFAGETIERTVRSFRTLLEAAIERPDRRIDELPLLDAAERRRVLVDWNRTEREIEGELTLHRGFERAADRDPGAPAVSFAATTLTYAQLEERANRWAHLLAGLGVRRGDRVGLWVDRRTEMVELVLGTLKAGAAYVPLDPAWPSARVAWALRDVNARVVVGEDRLLRALSGVDAPELRHRVAIDGALTAERLRSLPATRLDAGSDPEDCAYVLFTSGSTGAPKGVVVRHRPVANVIDWVNRTFAVTSADRLLFVTPYSFDLSVYDMLGILSAGASIRVAAAGEVHDPGRLWALLEGDGITFWDSAPATLMQLAPLLESRRPAAATLRLVFLSGDWIPLALLRQVRRAFPAAEVVGLGGATEAVIWSNFHRIGEVPGHWRSVPYGRPIQNARYYVLDERLEPCPIRTSGDLYIGGPVLADGYTDDAQTAERFVPDPHAVRPGAMMYHTGDRARFWSDGTIEFLGRADRQVKLRGHRIERGEVEAALGEHPAVAACVALVRPDAHRDQRLVAWYVPCDGTTATASDLRAHVARRLPRYMVPAAFVALEAIPVTRNGKLDADSLPDPPAARPELDAAFVAPRTPQERLVADVWSSVLGVTPIGIRDDFFELGGHSAAMVHVQAALEEALERSLSIAELFDHPTVASLAAHLSADPARRPHDDEPLQNRLRVAHRNRVRRSRMHDNK